MSTGCHHIGRAMLPPYDTEEVAEAIVARFTKAGMVLDALRVRADDRAREWIVTARLPDGDVKGATIPFSEPEGILTPAELAERFAGEVVGGG